jgi:hypothetical protein
MHPVVQSSTVPSLPPGFPVLGSRQDVIGLATQQGLHLWMLLVLGQLSGTVSDNSRGLPVVTVASAITNASPALVVILQ